MYVLFVGSGSCVVVHVVVVGGCCGVCVVGCGWWIRFILRIPTYVERFVRLVKLHTFTSVPHHSSPLHKGTLLIHTGILFGILSCLDYWLIVHTKY
jgi:hypothetical protein